jgi:hypothetical protein
MNSLDFPHRMDRNVGIALLGRLVDSTGSFSGTFSLSWTDHNEGFGFIYEEWTTTRYRNRILGPAFASYAMKFGY